MDDHCWFLAVDFDKEDWQEDVSAYVTTARRFGLAPAVERSRSGNGAHVWFFFAAPVSAADARKMASYMLTETMASRPELPMNSYPTDEVFAEYGHEAKPIRRPLKIHQVVLVVHTA